MSGTRRVSEFLGLRKSIVGMLGMIILVGMGERMAERFLPKYLEVLGGGWLAVGLLGGFDNLLSALYAFPGGYLADRLGFKRSLLVFNVMAMIGFLIVIFVPVWQAVIIGAFFFLSWTAISLPASMKLVANVLPSKKWTMGVSMHSFVRRIPMALGPLVGGLFIDAWGVENGVRLAFVVALAMAVVATVLQQILIMDDRRGGSGEGATKAERNPFVVFRLMNRPLKNLLVADILVRYCEQIPYYVVIFWCTGVIRAPVSMLQFGVLTTVEMATAMLIYIPVAYLAARSRKKPFVVMTFVFFTAFPLVLLFCQSFWLLVLAFVLRGLKEFGEPTRKALIMDLAPEGRKAAVFGLYYLLRDVIVSISAFGGAYLWSIGPKANLLTAFSFGVAGTVWFALRGQDLGARSADPTPSPS
ncbi:MAG: MFS transporter [Planctomycetota bacterium]